MSRTAKLLAFLLCVGIVLTQAGCAKLESRDEMNKGVQAYKNNKYADAVKHFKEAVRLDPTNQNAQLYLATSYMIQWVPGVDSPDNKKNYDMAKQEFDRVLQTDPKNSLALASLASMAFNSAQGAGTNQDQKMAFLQDAARWNQKRIEVDPKDAEPYYYLGVIAWTKGFAPIQTERVNEKLTPDNPGPLKDAKAKEELKAKYEKDINDGIDYLKKCLEYDKENEDAMSYMNLLLREKAYLEDSPEAAKADVAQAEDWSNKSLDMKRIKAARPQKKTET
ncbi:MAG TPA: tetratricopeptide repeat protein [Bryobacteraceae bacterium]|nr:tetratricopeptide repeat protein [Bryobacteraceae bacterium]